MKFNIDCIINDPSSNCLSMRGVVTENSVIITNMLYNLTPQDIADLNAFGQKILNRFAASVLIEKPEPKAEIVLSDPQAGVLNAPTTQDRAKEFFDAEMGAPTPPFVVEAPAVVEAKPARIRRTKAEIEADKKAIENEAPVEAHTRKIEETAPTGTVDDLRETVQSFMVKNGKAQGMIDAQCAKVKALFAEYNATNVHTVPKDKIGEVISAINKL